MGNYEDARRCPECTSPGEVTIKQPAPTSANLPQGTMIHHIFCRNKLCEWYNTAWMVQINPDGTVPEPKDHTGEDKVYMSFEGHEEMAKQIIAQLEAENIASLKPGTEVRNRGY